GYSRFRNRELAVTGAEIKSEGAAFRRGVLQLKQATVLFDDRIADGQAEACPGRLGRKIGIENFGAELFRDAGAAVGDGDLDVMTCWKNGIRRIIEHDVAGPDANGSAVRHRVPRIQHQSID